MSTGPSGARRRYIPTLTEVIGRLGPDAAAPRVPRAAFPAAASAERHDRAGAAGCTPRDAPMLGIGAASSDEVSEPADAVLTDADIDAIAERVAANARARLEPVLTGELRHAILPLVDACTEQIVARLHADLAHSLREAVTSAASEELERLRGRGQIPGRS